MSTTPELTPDEKRILKIYQDSKPASRWENKKSKDSGKKKKRSIFKKPEFYALGLAASGVVIVIVLGIFIAGINQAMDVNSLVDIAGNESLREAEEIMGQTPGWLDIGLWVNENIASVMLGIIGVFLALGAIVALGANIFRKIKNDNNAADE